ncbi:MAG TPA: glycosyltransferase [Verrucomicrobiales bacterium]|nr:glycosyltransferase [Verrucomicrobiales bacterium]HIL23786.1 glycosyltransferase [Verrucomicrobiota bacterium]
MILDFVRSCACFAKCSPWNLAASVGGWRGGGPPVQFVAENADWSVRWDGEGIRDGLAPAVPITMGLITKPYQVAHRVVHFGSQYQWATWAPFLSKTNHYAVSFFHGKPEDGPDARRHIDQFMDTTHLFSRVIVANKLVGHRLLAWGVDEDKMVRIPIGVDTEIFRPPSLQQRKTARQRLGFPEDAVVVGSFQKDGVGWGQGMEPKSIKGPDVFVAVVKQLAEELPIRVMLTGPARGYMKSKLKNLGIPYSHQYPSEQAKLADCYHGLDLYLISSREEGGPKGLMESMASGVPVVSTAVGMAPDLIEDEVTGGLAAAEDVEGLVNRARSMLALDDTARAQLTAKAREAVLPCDWKVVARRHWEEVYQPLLNEAA